MAHDSRATIWLLALLTFVFVSGAAAALWLEYVLRPKDPFSETIEIITQKVDGKTFVNEQVPLDGYHYENCTFQNTTFLYNGGRFAFNGNTIEGLFLRSNVNEINQFVRLMGGFGMLSVPAVNEEGNVSFAGVNFDDGPMTLNPGTDKAP
ncbi:hypothetical protein EOD08_11205 [Mesorhizobium sp. M6A.T.Ca.TU.002.02.2.1]|nr:hypothetical protein EOD08_11205 [Mesorhizobium sp. M6A.T.Ca.TU.002.02.2.1]